MPFLRFTRDKRGYETTSLLHAGRRQGRARQRILYWFRTPPGVRVGRPALDQEAIRWIEEHNPDIEFDWPKILEAQPSPTPPPIDERRARRVRRDKSDRPRSPMPPADANRGRERLPAAVVPPVPVAPEIVVAPVEILSEELESDAESDTESDALQDESDAPAVAEPIGSTLGAEQLTRLRARYAELQARITERGGEAARIEELRGQAEPLNPDTWVTEDEIRKGLQEFEPKIRDLRAALGLRRRRRSRRGGRRRKAPEAKVEEPAQ